MSYSPFQARGRDGKWVARGGNALASAAARRTGGRKTRSAKGSKTKSVSAIAPSGAVKTRGSGLSGLKANTVPYVRANKRSQTVGVNAGSIIPGTKKRIVIGGYARIESTTRTTATDRKVAALGSRVAPKGSKRAAIGKAVRSRVVVTNPAVRAAIGGAQVRLGTSRGAGPTVIVRRGKHKSPQPKSAKGVAKYDNRMRTIAGKKTAKPRPQRRKRK
jgi:hypothetical protein